MDDWLKILGIQPHISPQNSSNQWMMDGISLKELANSMTREQMASMPHSELYAARNYATPEQQNLISPYEHRAFAREAVADNPLMALPITAAIPLYQIYKYLFGARSQPSLGQVGQGLLGVGEGLYQSATR